MSHKAGQLVDIWCQPQFHEERTGETAQQLPIPTDPGSVPKPTTWIPAPTVRDSQPSVISAPGDLILPGFYGHLHIHDAPKLT